MASSRQKMNFRNVEKPDRGTPLLGLEGKKTLLPPVEGGVFLLTSSFIERAYRTSEICPDLIVRLPDAIGT
jgi:hypothetical protein